MSLFTQIQENLKQALKGKDEKTALTLRMLLAAIQNKEIETKKKDTGLTDEEIVGVIRSEAKKRRDSIDAFTKGRRSDLADKETAELKILEAYLPPEIPEAEVEKAVKDAIAETGAASQADFGKVMKATMAKLKGRAGGDKVSVIVKRSLNG